MKIRPLHDRIIVKRIEQTRTTASGIVLPDNAAEKPLQGEVIAVGAGRPLPNGDVRPLHVKAGDQVLFGQYGAQAVKLNGEEVLVLKEDDVLGIVDVPPKAALRAA